jgi:Aspartate/tyrosine/aromatic aminotransferase
MVELFEWESQDCEINLSISGIEPFKDINKLNRDPRKPSLILAERYDVNEDNITIVHSAQEGLFFCLLSLKPKEIFIPIPSYPPMFEQAELLGIKVNFVNDIYDLSNKFIILSNPNNPTGEVYDINKLLNNGNLVIADEIFKYFVKDEEYFDDNLIILSSTSKFFNIHERKVGWIVAKKEISEKIKQIKDLISPEPIYDKELIQYIYFNYGFFKERNLSIIKTNLKNIGNLGKYFKIVYNSYMPVLMLEREKLDSYTYCYKLLKNTGVLLTPMSFFKKNDAIRLYLGLGNHSLFEDAIKRIEEFNERYFKIST